MGSRVIHFEINADNPEKAAKFYEDVFGWKIKKWEGPVDYWLISTGEEGEPGIDGAIKNRSDNLSIVNTINVSSIEEAAAKIKAIGGTQISHTQSIPGVGYHTYCQDLEGNCFGLMQEDPTAK